MANFSFTSFLSSNGGSSATQGNTARRLSQPSEKQKSFYFDLCDRKKISRKDITQFTFDQLGKEIEQLQKLPDPASERQVAKIRELEKEIIALGGDLNPIGDAVINALSGGREGTASSLIQSLFDMRTALNQVAKPTDPQLGIMVEWYLCPDIPFESFSSEEVYAMKSGANMSESMTVTIEIPRRIDLGDGLWRHMTPDEFASAIKERMTKRQASKFIDDYRAVFYDWKKTRITSQQVNYIRELELRLANISTPKAVEFAVVDGEVQEIRNTTVDYNAEWNPMAYEPMDELSLAQFSYEQASQWIDQLKSELTNKPKTLHNEEEVYGQAQQQFEEKNLVRGENNRVRNEHDAKTDEFNKFNDLLFAVEAILGYGDDEVHEYATELMLDANVDSNAILERKQYIKNFFMSTVTIDPNKTGITPAEQKRWESQMARIFNMCDEIPVALEILAM